MAQAAPRPCTYPGCGLLTQTGRCERHAIAARKEADARRGSAAERGYGRAWQKASKGWLRQHPYCQCEDCGEGAKRLRLAVLVDHKVPHRGDQALFWNKANWQSMAKECHDVKTAREDGGFGNPRGVGRKSEAASP